MRIAIGGIATESCTFSPLPTRLEDFAVDRGDDFLERYPFLADMPVEAVPLLKARALPGGSVAAEAYAALKGEFLDLLRAAAPLDGVYLDLHGAMNVQGMDDAEGDWIAAVREAVGPGVLISASFDLHGNISRRVAENLDMLSAYRTAPHVDTLETRHKAFSILVDCLERGIRPLRAWVRIPVALPGEKTSTEWEPGQSVYAALPETDRQPGVIDASILVGYAWADEPRAAATVIVSGTERDTLVREAARLAGVYWAARRQFDFGVRAGSIDDCITWALAAPESSVFISDSGDNPTAGGAGDVPLFLKALVDRGVDSALVAGLADAPAVAACLASGVGAEVEVALGGKLDGRTSAPVPVRARVLNIVESENTEVLLGIGGVKAIVSRRRRPYHFIRDMQRVGAEPLAHKIVVVKIGYLEPDLKRHAPLNVLALSPGAVDQDLVRLPYRRIERPIFPLDPDMAWAPAPLVFPATSPTGG
ncbi:MAG: M81 family metallopeptidase [Anaerolineae bacterium]